MICDLTSFSTIFQSYQDDGQMLMKGLHNGTLVTVKKISPQAGLKAGLLSQ